MDAGDDVGVEFDTVYDSELHPGEIGIIGIALTAWTISSSCHVSRQ